MGMHPQYKRKMVLIMNKYDYTAKKHPALQTERYVPVTVNVPDKYDLLGTVSELLTAMHAVDMETVEGDVARCDVAFQRALGHFLRKGPGHDQLVFHLTEGQLLGTGVAAVEAHEGFLLGITVPALDILFIKVGRN